MNRRTQAFWEWLTGKKITEPSEVWKAYREHVERRNRVAHGREWPDANHGQDARDSVAAARAFMDRIRDRRGTATGNPLSRLTPAPARSTSPTVAPRSASRPG